MVADISVPCPHCESLNSLTAKRCRSCGRSMSGDAEEQGGPFSRLFRRFGR